MFQRLKIARVSWQICIDENKCSFTQNFATLNFAILKNLFYLFL